MKPLSYIGYIAICLISVAQLKAQDVYKTDSLELSLQLSHSDEQKVDLLLALATEYMTNDPAQARSYSNKALLLSDSIAYPSGQVTSMRILAELDWSSSDYKGALQRATKASALAKKIDDQVENALISRIFGLVFADLGSYEKSSQYFFESLRIFENLEDKIGISKSLNSIGYVLFEQENYDKALEYYFLYERKFFPKQGPPKGFHKYDPLYIVFIVGCIIKTDTRSPVMDHQNDILESKFLDKFFNVFDVSGEPIIEVRFVGFPHTDKVWSDSPADGCDMRNNVPPQVARCGISVQKEKGSALSLIDEVHLRT